MKSNDSLSNREKKSSIKLGKKQLIIDANNYYTPRFYCFEKFNRKKKILDSKNNPNKQANIIQYNYSFEKEKEKIWENFASISKDELASSRKTNEIKPALSSSVDEKKREINQKMKYKVVPALSSSFFISDNTKINLLRHEPSTRKSCTMKIDGHKKIQFKGVPHPENGKTLLTRRGLNKEKNFDKKIEKNNNSLQKNKKFVLTHKNNSKKRIKIKINSTRNNNEQKKLFFSIPYSFKSITKLKCKSVPKYFNLLSPRKMFQNHYKIQPNTTKIPIFPSKTIHAHILSYSPAEKTNPTLLKNLSDFYHSQTYCSKLETKINLKKNIILKSSEN